MTLRIVFGALYAAVAAGPLIPDGCSAVDLTGPGLVNHPEHRPHIPFETVRLARTYVKYAVAANAIAGDTAGLGTALLSTVLARALLGDRRPR
jgi:hypothetical protein